MRAAWGLLMRGFTAVLVAPIRLYRRFVSPWTPPTCRFTPTCSAYADRKSVV